MSAQLLLIGLGQGDDAGDALLASGLAGVEAPIIAGVASARAHVSSAAGAHPIDAGLTSATSHVTTRARATPAT